MRDTRGWDDTEAGGSIPKKKKEIFFFFKFFLLTTGSASDIIYISKVRALSKKNLKKGERV